MIRDFFWKKLIPASVLSAFVYLVFDRWHYWFLGAGALLFYFLFVSAQIRAILVNYFSFVKSLRARLLAMFLGLVTLGWILGIFIFFNYFNSLAIFLSFFANALIWSVVDAEKEFSLKKEEEEVIDEPPHAKISVLVYLGLVIYGFYLLAQSKTGDLVLSPWQVINSNYVWVFLVATFLLGALIIFSKVSLKTLLFFLVVHSFLLHSYLPLTHDLFYGADGWRHMATENRLLDRKQVLIPEVVGEQSAIAKSNVGVLSYANFWGTNVVLAKTLQIDLIFLTKWFLPILWSIIFTILLCEIGLALGWTGRKSLLLAWTGMLPFALQAGGSFSLPVNFGFLIFVLFFLLLLKRMQNPNNGQKSILLALGVGSALGYLLFFVLYWVSWVVMVVVKSGRKLLIVPSVILVALILPGLEVMARFSVWDKGVDILTQAKQFAGNLFTIYFASGPRPHDISGGNILFNQIPADIFTPNILTDFRWWLPIFVLAAFVFIILGIKKNIKDKQYQFILFSFVSLFIGYFLSFYILVGEHLFSRRLDATLAFLFLILLFYGFKDFLNKKFGILILAVLSLAITASYTLGPDTYTVKTDELEAAKYVWSQEENKEERCLVVGDTYFLLALEAVSGKEIIGGGFPIDANFAQPEREKYFKLMNMSINNNLVNTTAELTKDVRCWFVDDTVNISEHVVVDGDLYKVFGDVSVVGYNW